MRSDWRLKLRSPYLILAAGVAGLLAVFLPLSPRVLDVPVLILPIAGLAAFALTMWPEVSLALFVNGQAYYFYLMYRLHLTPVTAITGLVFTVELTAGALGLWLFTRGRRRLHLIDAAVFALFAWMGLSYLFMSRGHEFARIKLQYAPILAIIPFIAGRLFCRIDSCTRFLRAILGLAKLFAVISLYSLLTDNFHQGRFSPFSFNNATSDNPILIGITFSIAILILYIQLLERHIRLTIISAAWLLLWGYLVARAASRGAILALTIAILFYHVVRIPNLKRITMFFAISVTGYVIIANLPPETQEFYRGTVEYTEVNSTYLRLNFWKQSIQAFLERPLTGSGYGQLIDPRTKTVADSFPHNIVLETASELGIVGLIPLLFIFAVTALRLGSVRRHLHHHDRLTNLYYVASSLVVYTLVEANFSGFLSNQHYLFFSLGLCWAVISHLRRRPAISKGWPCGYTRPCHTQYNQPARLAIL